MLSFLSWTSSNFKNILRINRKFTNPNFGGFETFGAFFLGLTQISSTVDVPLMIQNEYVRNHAYIHIVYYSRYKIKICNTQNFNFHVCRPSFTITVILPAQKIAPNSADEWQNVGSPSELQCQADMIVSSLLRGTRAYSCSG